MPTRRDWAKSEKAKQEARKLFAELAGADPRVTYYQHHLADALQDLGILYHNAGKKEAAADKARRFTRTAAASRSNVGRS